MDRGSDDGVATAQHSRNAQAPSASTSAKPASTDLANSGASGIATASVLIPMQHVPQWDSSVTLAAVPDRGPNGYMRSSSAPATYSGNGEPGTLLVTKSEPLSMAPKNAVVIR